MRWRGQGTQSGDLRGHLVASLVGSDALERPVAAIRRCGDFKDLRLVLLPARCVSMEESLTFPRGPSFFICRMKYISVLLTS